MNHILLVDHYDSFTYNLLDLIYKSIPNCHVTVVKCDASDLLPHATDFSAIVLGPGPGSPLSSADVGYSSKLWTQSDVPVFGVCLGFQSLCCRFDWSIDRLAEVQHGYICPVQVTAPDHPLLKDVPSVFDAVRYHSLYAIPTNTQLNVLAHCTDTNSLVVPMAVAHPTLPYYGVQFHPESICSQYGQQIFSNFWQLAVAHNEKSHRNIVDTSSYWSSHCCNPRSIPRTITPPFLSLTYKSIDLAIDPVALCDYLKSESVKFQFLESAAVPGKHSIIAINDESSSLIYSALNSGTFNVTGYNTFYDTYEKGSVDGFYNLLQTYIDQQGTVSSGPADVPFWGGIVGYISYEAGMAGLGIASDVKNYDFSLMFARRSIVLSCNPPKVHILSVYIHDDPWVKQISSFIEHWSPEPVRESTFSAILKQPIAQLDREKYEQMVRQCQEYLHSGDSYELCLTQRVRVSIEPADSWEFYKKLRRMNPAPYACYLDLPGAIVASSSPERFLKWNAEGTCELRPIKGTVKKSSEMTFEKASEILNSRKERAENLMIVDLIRHDLNQICTNVEVSQLMKVEEYETVYQLVSAIIGTLRRSFHGLDLLRHALPPGSMTGAPKKRSVDILKSIEQDKTRGIYSGVIGYLDVAGRGDWSVVIRTAVLYTKDTTDTTHTWTLGAGGAVVALSTPEGEYEEMQAKLYSACQVFLR
ncbi:hypothetical protein CANCADRAFT_1893 [Tortispora caseinolytica NRRL Y-17796]|uniref:aminodeoxychorismate synthase n=1 Tax=Tortispora caseinolytica NRRL Y-17796 TaxID=767744 RepID=A0A1E4TEH5_9ASCO|nr:hypothetical protein CANCADRAFT_1893 [Tortispora caseinolytica NRRL Y-17796]